MKIRFYEIKTGKIHEMTFEEAMKGVPIGWILLELLLYAK